MHMYASIVRPPGGAHSKASEYSEWVGFNGRSTQFRSLAPSLTRKAGTESTTVEYRELTLYKSCQRDV